MATITANGQSIADIANACGMELKEFLDLQLDEKGPLYYISNKTPAPAFHASRFGLGSTALVGQAGAGKSRIPAEIATLLDTSNTSTIIEIHTAGYIEILRLLQPKADLSSGRSSE